jgi:hypothetical protein
VPNCAAALLILLIMMPLVPLEVPYFFFISSANAFSFDLSSIISARSIPWVSNPMICGLRSIVMGTGLSSYMSPPCATAKNCLMHVVIYVPLPKFGSFNKPKILVLSSPTAHWCGWLIISPSWFIAMVFIKILCASFRNLVSSDTSLLEYLSFPTLPSSFGCSCTPTGMHGRTISIVGFLWGELDI